MHAEGLSYGRISAVLVERGHVTGSGKPPFEAQAPPNGPPALTKMTCRWHCPHQRQGGGIHQRAAGNVLHSLVSSLPIGPTSLLYLRSETRDLFQSSLPRKAICFPPAQLNVKKIHV
jgi:hypothetical protein